MNHQDFITACRSLLGERYVLTGDAQANYLTDWRQRYLGEALATLRPATTDEVASIVKLCIQANIGIVPQGGNTGLCGGATPIEGRAQIILSLLRLNNIRAVDTANQTITVEAGCLLQTVQETALAQGCLFPLSLASEGSCTIGGNLSTNAGGTAVLRYGNTRELCLGLEVVTAQGEVWNGLRGLRKDNTGYDLRDLFIGAEGTLGIITAAVMKLVPQPKSRCTALVAAPTPRAAVALLQVAKTHADALLTGFELFSAHCLELVLKHFPLQRSPFTQPYAQYILIELSGHQEAQHTLGVMEGLLEQVLQQDLIEDAAIAQSTAQAQQFWALREHISLAQATEGKNLKHDISVPISSIADFIESTDALIKNAFPAIRMVTFGHLGDGNLHYNVSPPTGTSHDDFLKHQDKLAQIIYNSVAQYNGSFSAEHGIGQLKTHDLVHYKSSVEIALMRAIKFAFDPHQLMNVGKVL